MLARIHFHRSLDGYIITKDATAVGQIYYGASPTDKVDPRLRYSWNLDLPALGIHRAYSYQQDARKAAEDALLLGSTHP